jgi:predicted protein tyrosine phosphatase
MGSLCERDVADATPLPKALCAREVMVNLLFICSENRLRSPTGEEVFSAYDGITAIGAGTNNDSATPVSGDLIEWADIIFVMERSHRNKVSKKFKSFLKGKKLVCLDIPDDYDRMDPVLIRLLEIGVSKHVPLRKST